jgi:RNA polymerase sigma-70 factor (ECF subfamily)
MLTLMIEAIEEPDKRAFIGWLYDEFKLLMFATAGKYVSDPDAQEDIVQDGLVNLIRKADMLMQQERCILSSYIVSTIRNTAFNYLKRQNLIRSHTSHVEDSFAETEDDAPSLDEMLILMEKKAQLWDIWELLQAEEQFLLSGKYLLGYSDQELAEQLGCKASSVRMKLTRARRKALSLLTAAKEEYTP